MPALRLHEDALRIDLVEGRLSGPGADLIGRALDNVQFVALGEEHNKRAVHRFADALFAQLQSAHGFEHIVLEEDPLWARMLSQTAQAQGAEGVIGLALQYPNAFHLDTVDEMQFIGAVGQRSRAAQPVWGVNQMFGAAHAYARLLELAPSAEARALALRQQAQLLPYERERFARNRNYLVWVATASDFEALRRAYAPAAGSEADFIIDQLARSQAIFAPYSAAPKPSSQVFHDSGEARERNMKQLFARQYRTAQAAGEATPKVLALLGQLHLYRGLSERTQQYTFGNLLSELAEFDGMRSLHIYTAVDAGYVHKGPFAMLAAAARAAAGDGFAGVVDLRPLMDRARNDPTLSPELKRLILGYDLFLLFPDAQTGSIERLRTPAFHWYPG